MKTSVPSNRLVSAFAVAAVSIAALAAAASAFMGSPGEAPPATEYGVERPAADAPVRVVKAPVDAAARQQPASCRDCAAPAAERSL